MLSALPAEVTLQILSYLEWVDLLNVAETCTVLYNLHNDRALLQSAYVIVQWTYQSGPKRVPPVCPILDLIDRFKHVGRFVLGAIDCAEVKVWSIMDRCADMPNLKAFTIHGTNRTVDSYRTSRVPCKLESLEIIYVSIDVSDLCREYLDHMPNLRHLKLLGAMEPAHYNGLFKPRLLTSFITDLALENSDVQYMAAHWHLESLGIHNPSHITGLALGDFRETLKHLAYHNETRRGQEEEQFFSGLQSIQSVDMTGSTGFRDLRVQRLAQARGIKITLPCGFASVEESILHQKEKLDTQRWRGRKSRAEARRAWFELAQIGVADTPHKWRLPEYIDRIQYTYQDPANLFPPDDSDTESMI